MTGLPTSSNGHGSRLPIRAQAAPMEENPVRAQGAATTDEPSTRDQRSTPVRAREAATTDGHGQRPYPVRAREAVTTDELSTRDQRPTVETLYKNIACRNNLVWKNIFSRRENFVSGLRITSFPRIFLGIIDLFLYPDS